MIERNRRHKKVEGESKNKYISPTCPPGWAWLLAGIMIGMFISFLIYLREIAPYNLPPEDSTVKSSYLNENMLAEGQDSDTPLPQFDFMVPDSDVKAPETSTQEKTPSADLPITIPGRYLLQVGSFRNEHEAEGLKGHLATLGISATVQPTNLTDKGKWYRVQVGPFTDLDELNKTRSLLAENSLGFILLKF